MLPKIVETYSAKKIFKKFTFLPCDFCWFFDFSIYPNPSFPQISLNKLQTTISPTADWNCEGNSIIQS